MPGQLTTISPLEGTKAPEDAQCAATPGSAAGAGGRPCCIAAGAGRVAAPPRLEGVAKEQYAARARVLKALAHPTRLFIVDRLAEREHCVCELTELIGADVSTVSKHLSVLANAGVAQPDKRGSQVWYSLRVPCILEFFGCVEAVLGGRAR